MGPSRLTPGATLLLLAAVGSAACGGGGGTEPLLPAAVAVSPTAISFTALGQTQQVTAAVTDASGAPIASPELGWTSSDDAVASVSGTGLVTAAGVGSAVITATAGSVGSEAAVTVMQSPAQIQRTGGDNQTVVPGRTATQPLTVRVSDANDLPVPGVSVTFSTAPSGGATLGAPTTTTGADGVASTTLTVLGSGPVQIIAVVAAASSLTTSFTATGVSPFTIELQFLDPPTPAQRQAFEVARDRWQDLITSELSSVALVAPAGTCGDESPAVNRTVDDLLILVSLQAIDGAGNILGAAAPCYIRDPGKLTVLGLMRFDTADLDVLENAALLQTVVLHEMGHVLGFGTLWGEFSLLADPATAGGTDPHFTGAQAIAAFNAAGGTAYSGGQKVPVEDTGGPGTRDAHWRESVLGTELMTGFVQLGANPLSRLSVASFADMGYTVNLAAADPFTFAASLRAFGGAPRTALSGDVLRLPVHTVDGAGRVLRVVTP